MAISTDEFRKIWNRTRQTERVVHEFEVALVALAAAFCYAASNVLEHRKAAAAPRETSMRISLLWYLARQPIWWLAIAVDLGGFGFQVLALGLGDLLFVQPLLVMSLLFSLVLGAMRGSHRLSLAELGWATLLMAGLSTFLVVARPSGGFDERPFRAWTIPFLLLILLVGACVTMSRRATPAWRAVLLAAAAGTTFGVSSTLMKTFSHRLGDKGITAMITTWEPYAMALVVALGFLILQSAVPGRRPACRVALTRGGRADHRLCARPVAHARDAARPRTPGQGHDRALGRRHGGRCDQARPIGRRTGRRGTGARPGRPGHSAGHGGSG